MTISVSNIKFGSSSLLAHCWSKLRHEGSDFEMGKYGNMLFGDVSKHNFLTWTNIQGTFF